jgi:hypothetical protein
MIQKKTVTSGTLRSRLPASSLVSQRPSDDSSRPDTRLAVGESMFDPSMRLGECVRRAAVYEARRTCDRVWEGEPEDDLTTFVGIDR